jgi:diguanylate cyclase (GGDEF)-like protein
VEFLDIDTIASLQEHLAAMSGFSLAIHGEKGNIILPPVNESKILTAVRSSSKGREEYDEFVKKNIDRALQRNDVSFLRGPCGHYFFFIPLRVENSVFAIAGGGVFVSKEDFETFCLREGPSYGLSSNQLKSWYQESSIRDLADLQNAARYVRSIFHLTIKSSYKGMVHEKRYRVTKTILSLLSEINLEKQAHEVYSTLADIVMFLFNAESVSVMLRSNDEFECRKPAGRLRDYLQTVSLKMTEPIFRVIEQKKPVYTESALDILRMGFNDKVTSLYAFPLVSDEKVTGILNIFNTVFDQEDADIIRETCRLSGCIFRIIELQEAYRKNLRELDVLNVAATRLIPVKDPDELCEAILETSVHLTEAEKGSLMLAGKDPSFLTVKAAKGIHKRLFSEIRIRAGEGIAGWVFREGVPLKVDDIEKNALGFMRRPHYRTGSCISVPLKLGETTIGVLNISDKITSEMFSEEDMILLRSFAFYASIALERSNYYSLAGHLKELSITDPLTGLFNRRYFEERFFEELHRSDRHNLSFSLAMMDIDDFKLFNDSEGHLAGDEILRHISNVSKDCLRVSDVISRFGGEEFAVIMPQTEKDEALLVAERIRQSIKEYVPRNWTAFPRKSITVSIGIATFPQDGRDRKELIRNSDRALYKAKIEGKDRTVLWESRY